MINLFITGVALAAAQGAEMSETEYRQRLSSLKESQAATQAYLSRLSGFTPAPSTRGTSEEEDPEMKRPLFRTHSDLKSNRLRAGSVWKAMTQNQLVVGGESSPTILVASDGQGVLSNLKLIGQARPSGTEGRIHLEVTRIVLNSGKIVPIQGIGLDPSGAQGLAAHVVSGKALAVAGSIASSFVAGVAAAKTTQTTNAFGFQQNQPTGRNAILGGIAQTAADQSKRLIEEATSEKPVLILPARTPLAIFLQEEVRF